MSKSHRNNKNSSHRSSKTGMAPGTMVFIGERKRETSSLEVVNFSSETYLVRREASVLDCNEMAKMPGITWVNVNGLHDISLIESIGKIFGLHVLTLEDIVNTGQRLKAEDFGHYFFIVLKMMKFNETTKNIDLDHMSLILGKNFVISFLENESGICDVIRERIASSKGRIRSMGPDYLTYALIDNVVDHYFLALESLGDHIENLDDQILENPQTADLKIIHELKRDILSMRKAVWPLREELGALEKSESLLLPHENKMYWRDLYDHSIQVIDIVENFRDILASMHDTYLSSVSNRMNEIMKVLTIIATIFIPLTFITSLYGMNFEFMPELKWTWGYPMALGIMLSMAVGLLVFFKKKKWI